MKDKSESVFPKNKIAEDQGDWKFWDQNWKSLGEDKQILYTPDQPRTVRQFVQRCYFEDLWHLMGTQAKKSRYLELGSGRGTTSMYLASQGCDVTMVDLSPSAFEVASRNFSAYGLKQPDFITADAGNTDLPSEQWDCIHNIGLLEHFEDPVPVIREALRLLKPGGLIFMVIVPAVPPSRSLPIRMVFNPVIAFGGIAKRIVKNILHYKTRKDTTTIRTDYSCEQYLNWVKDMPCKEAECFSYNPYHQIYKTPQLEALITLPLYSWHYRQKKAKGKYPLLRTSLHVAICHLLIAKKV